MQRMNMDIQKSRYSRKSHLLIVTPFPGTPSHPPEEKYEQDRH